MSGIKEKLQNAQNFSLIQMNCMFQIMCIPQPLEFVAPMIKQGSSLTIQVIRP